MNINKNKYEIVSSGCLYKSNPYTFREVISIMKMNGLKVRGIVFINGVLEFIHEGEKIKITKINN